MTAVPGLIIQQEDLPLERPIFGTLDQPARTGFSETYSHLSAYDSELRNT